MLVFTCTVLADRFPTAAVAARPYSGDTRPAWARRYWQKRNTEAGMVALGSRGVGGFTRMLLGSTAGQVVQHALPGCHVLPEDRG